MRDQYLALAVANAVATRGYRVEAQGCGQAILTKGKSPNHVLHLVVTLLLFLLGLATIVAFFIAAIWAVVWVILAMTQIVHAEILPTDQAEHKAFVQTVVMHGTRAASRPSTHTVRRLRVVGESVAPLGVAQLGAPWIGIPMPRTQGWRG